MAGWLESWMPGTSCWTERTYRERLSGRATGASGGWCGVGGGIRSAARRADGDWFIGYGIAAIFATPDPAVNPWFGWLVLGVWFVLTAVPVAAFGASAGMMALGLRVLSVDGRSAVGVGRTLLRTALIAVVAPPLVRDVDGRGWHDRAAHTVVVRTRP